MNRITIVGTGYVGTSIGLALKEHKVEFEIVGHDREHGRALAAKKRGAIDRADWNLPAALEKASLVVVATPLSAMQRLFSQMAEFLEPGCIVTDTASLKRPTLAWAEASFGDRVSYVGGNPIVGADDGHREPTATLFQGCTYCVVASSSASAAAIEQVIRLVRALGAEPLFVDPVEHDSHLAAVNQLPALVAAALVSVATSNPAWRDGQRLAGPTFGSVTGPTLGDPTEQRTQFQNNREVLAVWIQALRDELGELGRQLEEDPDGLQRALEAARDARAAWRPGMGPQADAAPVDLPRARDQFSNWFLGGLGGRGRK
ncbi:MAG TPA: prephenate dehydrogenase/arogenate dehydrogenase family protein [Chloroflexota bacterium]|nr:prephenate dehydrogenase/arogenate dehydrogenase family protein [Chloroflexota bacterium]